MRYDVFVQYSRGRRLKKPKVFHDVTLESRCRNTQLDVSGANEIIFRLYAPQISLHWKGIAVIGFEACSDEQRTVATMPDKAYVQQLCVSGRRRIQRKRIRMPHETIDQLRRRLEIQEAERDEAPTPDEIAERAAALRRSWVDERGVAKPEIVFGNKARTE